MADVVMNWPPVTADEIAFWAEKRARLSEGFCPATTCRERLAPTIDVPSDGVGGRCPRHGVRWMRRSSLASF